MKTTVYIGTSLDGYIARKDGDIDWLMAYASADIFAAYEDLMTRIDTVLMGRKTFEKVCSFNPWPYKMKIFVLTNTLNQVPESVAGKVELLTGSPSEAIRYLQAAGYASLYVDGGELIQGCLSDDLVDELIISTVPVLIGSGIPLFGFLGSDLTFKHRKTNSFANGLVMSFYDRES